MRLVFLGRSWWWRQRYLDAERIQNSEGSSDLAGILALFKVDDEPYSGSGGQSKVLLRNTQVLAGLADQFANLLGCISQARRPSFPYGNIVPDRRQSN